KKEDYFAELQKLQKREADAKAEMANLEARMNELQGQITAAEEAEQACRNEIYAMLGTDEAGYNAFVQQCRALESDLNAFVSLSGEEIYKRRDELESYRSRLAELRMNKISLGPQPFSILNRCESLINQAQQKLDAVGSGRYTVLRGDYLWKISGKTNVYGDPYAWIRIYSANRSQIKNPDLIYPQQVFEIPRLARSNEHWVARGESLSDIAKRYGTAFSWQQIYQANKESIGADPNLIFPHQVLTIPGR
ncbi:MAG TPA: LysM peptidoglycan-binding domain-containing protein, partial [Calditrichia bacterium]|nr:LysM peptidoglycan-binding domain-containing protein [Calditrichia bacterium]